MKLSAIDIGSNSVRLLMWADGRSLYKKIHTTRLGEGLVRTGTLSVAAMQRTAEAVASFFAQAKEEGASRVYAFATAAVRRASNGGEFCALVRRLCGLDVRVLTGEEEARVGLWGATEGRDGGIIDVGGASTEVTIGKGGEVIYAVSANVGAVKLKDACGEDRAALEKYIADSLTVYGSVPHSRMYAIGGTATSLCALEYGVEPYDPAVIDGKMLSLSAVYGWADKLLSMRQEERLALKGMDKPRADILGGGALLLGSVMRLIGAEEVIVSEKDNLEGFVSAMRGGLL